MLAWHYTYGHHIRAILDEGRLAPGKAGAESETREKPVVWFSTNEVWEPTSAKADANVDPHRPLSRAELAARGGCFRIAVDTKILKPWVRIRDLARIRPDHARLMEAYGRSLGSDPFDWWGALHPVLARDWKRVEFLKNDRWEEFPVDQGSRAILELNPVPVEDVKCVKCGGPVGAYLLPHALWAVVCEHFNIAPEAWLCLPCLARGIKPGATVGEIPEVLSRVKGIEKLAGHEKPLPPGGLIAIVQASEELPTMKAADFERDELKGVVGRHLVIFEMRAKAA